MCDAHVSLQIFFFFCFFLRKWNLTKFVSLFVFFFLNFCIVWNFVWFKKHFVIIFLRQKIYFTSHLLLVTLYFFKVYSNMFLFHTLDLNPFFFFFVMAVWILANFYKRKPNSFLAHCICWALSSRHPMYFCNAAGNASLWELAGSFNVDKEL